MKKITLELEFEVSLQHGTRYRYGNKDNWRYYKLGPIPKDEFSSLLVESANFFDTLSKTEPPFLNSKMSTKEFHEMCGHQHSPRVSER